MDGWPLLARLWNHPEISPESNSVQSLQKPFRWDHKLIFPMCVDTCKRSHIYIDICVLKVMQSMSDFGENTRTASIHPEVSVSSKCSTMDSTQKKRRELQGGNASDGGSSFAITGEESGLCFQSTIHNDFLSLLFRLFEWLVHFINNQIKSDSFENVIGTTFSFLHLMAIHFILETSVTEEVTLCKKKLTLDLFSWFYQAQLWMVRVAHNSIFHLTERKLKGAAYDLCYCSVVLQQVCWTSTGLRPSTSTAWSSCASTTPTSACSSTTSLTSSRTFRSAQSAVLCTTINTFKSTLKTHLFSLCHSD